MILRKVLGLLLALPLLAGAASDVAAQGSPKQVLQQTNDKINALLRKQHAAGSPAEKKSREEIKRIVNGFLDFEELGRQALGHNWGKRTKNEQTEFVELLRELIERNYVKQLRGNLDYKIEYTSEQVQGEEATVGSTVRSAGAKPGTRPFETKIEYKLRKNSSKWMVYDVITDEVSLVRNYRSQFNRIINKESYEALVKKMKNKLAEEG